MDRSDTSNRTSFQDYQVIGTFFSMAGQFAPDQRGLAAAAVALCLYHLICRVPWRQACKTFSVASGSFNSWQVSELEFWFDLYGFTIWKLKVYTGGWFLLGKDSKCPIAIGQLAKFRGRSAHFLVKPRVFFGGFNDVLKGYGKGSSHCFIVFFHSRTRSSYV